MKDVLYGIQTTFDIAILFAVFALGLWYLLPIRPGHFTKGVLILGFALLIQKVVLIYEATR